MNNPRKSQKILKNVGYNLLSEGKSIRIKAHGYSMYPCIKPGAIVLIEPLIIKGKPVPGEIIAIKRENGLIIHRLIKVIQKDGQDYFIARGDSNARTDDPIKLDRIAGRVVGADISATNTKLANTARDLRPNYIINRFRVVGIILWSKIRKLTR
jgi:signal peptidase I